MQRTSEQTLRRRQAYLDEYMESLPYRMMVARAASPENSFAVPETPNPNLGLSKRQWEEALSHWRNHVKMLANFPHPKPTSSRVAPPPPKQEAPPPPKQEGQEDQEAPPPPKQEEQEDQVAPPPPKRRRQAVAEVGEVRRTD